MLGIEPSNIFSNFKSNFTEIQLLKIPLLKSQTSQQKPSKIQNIPKMSHNQSVKTTITQKKSR